MSELDNLPPVLKVRDVAELLNVHPQTVYARIADGSLRATKQGGRFYIRKDSVEALLNGEPLPQSA